MQNPGKVSRLTSAATRRGYFETASMTSALTPALSPRRGRIVRRSFENLYDWIGRTLIRKTRKLFPLLGERIKGEGGRKHSFH
jgi:hypothetical protein